MHITYVYMPVSSRLSSRRGNLAAGNDSVDSVCHNCYSSLVTLGIQREAELLVFAVSWQLSEGLGGLPCALWGPLYSIRFLFA